MTSPSDYPQAAATPRSRPPASAERVIRVVAGDLARQAVDAVVRPADATLAPVGPAALHLDELGGERFAAQRRTATPLEAGAAVVTGAGGLAAGYVLHVVIADERGL